MSEFAPKKKRLPKLPQDKDGWRDVAVRYLERFEAPGERVRTVLKERARLHNALSADVERMIDEVVQRLEELRIIDDGRYAEMRANSLARQGKGTRSIKQDLKMRGVADDLIATTIAKGAWTEREAALSFAKKKRLGPYRKGRALDAWKDVRDKQKQKEMAAFARAGHSIETALFVINAEDEAVLTAWLEEGEY